MRKPSAISLATALAFATMFTFSACGGTASTPVPTTPGSNSYNGPGPSGNAVITAGAASMNATPAAAPSMPNVLAAQVTIGSITAANADGSTTTILANPATVELAHLGSSNTLLDVDPLPQGTYNSITFTITAAQVTYLNAGAITTATSNPPSGTTANLTIPTSSASLTETFSSPVVVNWQNASDLNLSFDLAQSLSLNGSTGMVTFAPSTSATTPTASVTLAQVASLSAQQTLLHVNGAVASTNDTNGTLALTTDSGYSATVGTTSSTVFSGVAGVNALKAGAAARTDATINADGTLSALTVETVDNGAAETSATAGTADEGIVTGTAGSGSAMTSFTMVVTNSTNSSLVGQQITVDVNPGTKPTAFAPDPAAAYVGQSAKLTFDATQIFAGQAVWVAGATDVTSTKTNTIVDAAHVNQSPTGLQASIGAVTATVGSDSTTDVAYNFPLTTSFSGFANGSLVAAVAQTCAAVGTGAAPSDCTAANLEGPYLNPINLKALPPATNTVGVYGFLTQSGGVNN
ncbi:MAG: DUF4382 domain-containing protein, partial [Terriglobales bacterium]